MGQCTSDPESSYSNNDYQFARTATLVSSTGHSGTAKNEKKHPQLHRRKSTTASMVKIDISDESIYQSDFESDNDYYIGDELEHEQVMAKSRRTSCSAATVPNDAVQAPPEPIVVEDVVKKSGCETFVINFNDQRLTKPMPKKVRPKTTAACSTRLKVKPSTTAASDFKLEKVRGGSGGHEGGQEVNSKVLEKRPSRRAGLRSAFVTRAGLRPKKTTESSSSKPTATGGRIELQLLSITMLSGVSVSNRLSFDTLRQNIFPDLTFKVLYSTCGFTNFF